MHVVLGIIVLKFINPIAMPVVGFGRETIRLAEVHRVLHPLVHVVLVTIVLNMTKMIAALPEAPTMVMKRIAQP